MDRCPVELITDIFYLACTDEGLTRRSLSLVCKDFHAISLPFRFRCLAIYSRVQLDKIIHILDALPPHLRRVQHLSICILDVSANNLVSARVPSLLRIVAANLVSFCLSTPERWDSLIPIELPALEELTLYTCLSSSSFLKSSHAPRLQLLHVVAYKSLPDDLGGCISRIAPSLTHLRLSNVSQDCSNGGLIKSVALLASDGSYTDKDLGSQGRDDHVSAFPRTLKRCIIAQAATRAITYDSVQCLYTNLSSQLECISAEDSSGTLYVLKLAPYKNATLYWDESSYDVQALRAHHEWSDRITGRSQDGCWNPKHIRVVPLKRHRESGSPSWIDIMTELGW